MACVVPGCKSHTSELKEKKGELSFHQFPADPDLKNKWIRNIRRPKWEPTKFSRICSLHFEPSCFRVGPQRKLLHSYAVPTIFTNQPASLHQVLPKKRTLVMRMRGISAPSTSASKAQDSVASTSKSADSNEVAQHEYLPKKRKLAMREISVPVSTSPLKLIDQNEAANQGQLVPEKEKPTRSSVLRDATNFLVASTSVAENAMLPDEQEVYVYDAINPSTSTDENVPTAINPKNDLEKKIKRLEAQLSHYKQLSERRGRKLKNTQRKCSRLLKKTTVLQDIIKDLNSKMESEHVSILQNSIDCPAQIFSRYLMRLKGSSLPKEYPTEIKKFAITLQYLSPRAYNHVRNTFNTILPHPKTLSKWYQTVNCEPGFTKESFDVIKSRCDENSKTLYCALSMDEMSIRKQLQWDGQKYYGQISIGQGSASDDNLPLASEAITFMVTCINESWKIPVGFFFINGLTGQQKRNLIEQCLFLLNDTGIKTVSLTFDGAAANASMAQELGCDLSPENLKTTFEVGGQEVAILYDPCHNIKLVRNSFGEKFTFLDDEGENISWHYLELLQQLQDQEGLRAGNKLTAAHIYFQKQKMKVKLASQLLSNSVADALQFCKDLGIVEFQNCKATIRFIRVFNELFDILNTRNMAAKGYKKPLCYFNIDHTKSKLKDIEKYIDSLKTSDGTLLVHSRRKTGYLGFKICIRSILIIYEKYVAPDSSFWFLPTHKLSQDHVEVFFAAIRSQGGFNNNPSAKAFISAYKKLLIHAEFKISQNANCLPLENIQILRAKSSKPRFITAINESSEKFKMLNEEENYELNTNELNINDNDHDYEILPTHLTTYSENVVHYIAGYIIRKLLKKIICEKCVAILREEGSKNNNILTKIKNKGGLFDASSQIATVCKYSEKVLRHFIKIKGVNNVGSKNIYLKMINQIFSVCGENKIFRYIDHGNEFGISDNHVHLLIKGIIDYFLKIRLHYECPKISQPKEYIRNYLTKIITFKGQ